MLPGHTQEEDPFSFVGVVPEEDANFDSGIDRRVIGQIKTQWNEDNRLMQLLSLLFEVHTFGEPNEVPEKVWEGVAKSIFEIENVVLNSFLTDITSHQGRTQLQNLVDVWKREGPSMDFYDVSGDLLDTVVQPEITGEVHPTRLQSLWEFVGFSSRLPWLASCYAGFTIIWLLGVVALIVAVVVPMSNEDRVEVARAVNIIVGVVLVVTCSVVSVGGLAVAHHNAVMHGIVNFMEVQRLKEFIPPDEGEASGDKALIEVLDHLRDVSQHNTDAVTLEMSAYGGATARSNGLATFDALRASRGLPPHENDRSAVIPHLGTSALQGSMMGFSATALSQLAQEVSGDTVRALVLSADDAQTASLCRVLWNKRVAVTSFTTFKEFAIATVRCRGDRLRLYIICADLITESDYSHHLRAMEEASGLVYFSGRDPSESKVVPPALVQNLPFSSEDVDRIIHSLQPQQAAVPEIFKPVKQFHVPHYTLGRRLGGGAFGNVFEAEMDVLAGRCAVKRMYVKPGEGQGKLREIAREVEVMCRLQHPNIVQYLFCKREGNCICIFMELCEGSLQSLITKRELHADNIKHYLRQIIEAVAYLHSRQFFHRDLKPENVLFRNGNVKLTDFGTAAKYKPNSNESRGNVKGTFSYMAPEVLLAEAYGPQCDVWSIGCIAADMLGITLDHRCLGLPALTDFFKALTPAMAIEVECDEGPLKDFIELCLRRDPQQRPTPANLLKHPVLRSDEGSIRRHTEMMTRARGSLQRKASLGVQSLRSLRDASAALGDSSTTDF